MRSGVVNLILRSGISAFDGGVPANAVAVESLTAGLISLNLQYKVMGAGVRLTVVPRCG